MAFGVYAQDSVLWKVFLVVIAGQLTVNPALKVIIPKAGGQYLALPK